jgi:hypothetical protein
MSTDLLTINSDFTIWELATKKAKSDLEENDISTVGFSDLDIRVAYLALRYIESINYIPSLLSESSHPTKTIVEMIQEQYGKTKAEIIISIYETFKENPLDSDFVNQSFALVSNEKYKHCLIPEFMVIANPVLQKIDPSILD